MRSNGIIVMVVSSLENQSQCWKGLTVSSPDWNMPRKVSLVTFVLLLPPLCSSGLQSGISGGSQWFPTHPAKQLGRDRALGPGGWKWPQDPAAPAREPGAPWIAGMKALDTWGSQHDGSCLMGCAGTGQAKECSASAPWGEERLFI